jgi:uncharacterized lipoprotein
MMKFRAAVLILAAFALLLGGCKSWRGSACNKPQDYQKARSVPALVIPPGLTGLDTSTALKLPALNEPAPPPRTTHDPCLDAPPAYKVAKPATAPQA